MNPGMRDACWCVPNGWRVLLAAVFALAALPLSGARADVTAQVPTVVARVLPPEFVATATAASTPSDGLISSSLAVSPITGLLVGDQGFVTLSPRSPGVFAGARTDIWWRPATYYWQAYDRHCSLPSPPACHSAPVAFQVTPLPAPAMVAPADGAQHVNGTPLTITVQDVPAYDGARQLSVEYSRSPELAPSGLFAQPFLGAFPAPSWVLASSVPATGTATQTLATGNTAALAHARIYWHALRKDCWAEPDCMVTDGVRSFTITPGPVPGYPGLDPETRVLFAIPPQIPIGYLLVKRAHPHKVKIGDVTAAMNCRALPCHVSTRVTIRLGGRTLLRAGRTFARPADPAKWWSDANHIERVKVSKRLRAQIMTALKRNRRVSVTAIATATDLAGRPERHVSRGTFFLSPARTK